MAHDTITKRAADNATTIRNIRIGDDIPAKLGEVADQIVALAREASNGAPKPVLPIDASRYEDEHEERGYGVFHTENDGGPLFVFFGLTGEADAEREMVRRQALDSEDESWLSQDCCVCRCETAMLVWNSMDPDPRVALDAGTDGED